MLTLRIAWRNIFRQKRRTILTVLSIFGGFTLSAISIGWADGTYNRIIDMFTRNRLGHIQVHAKGYLDRPSLYKNIPDYQQVGAEIAGVRGVEAWSPRLYAAGLASIGDKSSGVRIIGIDPQRENIATHFDKQVTQGTPLSTTPEHQALLGKGLARTLKAGIGDSVVIVSQAADGSIANDIYAVVGIVESGDMAQDRSSFYLHLKDAQDLFVLPGVVHEIVVIVNSLNQVLPITHEIATKLDNPDLDVEPWQEFARSFYVAMTADKQGSWIMLFVVILIVAIGVLNTVLMTVLERTREYGVLRAVGSGPGQIFRLVIYEVFLMGCIGIIIGAGLSLGANYLLSLHGIPMPEAFTYGGVEFTHYYSEVNAHSFYIPAITVMFAAMVISIFPALKAARIEPARALRTH
jgi:putative ABC transport system permease protein